MKASTKRLTGILVALVMLAALACGIFEMSAFTKAVAEELSAAQSYNEAVSADWKAYNDSESGGMVKEGEGWNLSEGVNTYLDTNLNVQEGVSLRFDTAEIAYGKRIRFTFQDVKGYVDYDKVTSLRIELWLVESADWGGEALLSEIDFSTMEAGQTISTVKRRIENLTSAARTENGAISTEHVLTLYKDNGKYYFLRDHQPFHAASDNGNAAGFDKARGSLGFDPKEVGFDDSFLTSATLAVSSEIGLGKVKNMQISTLSRDKNWLVSGFEAQSTEQGFLHLQQDISSVGQAMYQYPLDLSKRMQVSLRINNYPSSTETGNDDGRNYLMIALSKDKEFKDVNTAVYSVALYQSAILAGQEGTGAVCLKSSVCSYNYPQFNPNTTVLKSPHNFDMGVNVKGLGAAQSNLNALEFNINDMGSMSWFYNAAYAPAFGDWRYGVAYKFGSTFVGDGAGYTSRPTYDHVVDTVTDKDFPDGQVYVSVMAVSPDMTTQRYWDVDLAITQEGQMETDSGSLSFEKEDAKDMDIALSTFHTQIDTVNVDGTAVGTENYTLNVIDTQHSVLILKKEYLSALAEGSHSITVTGTHLQPTGSYGYVPMNAPQQDKYKQRLLQMNSFLPAGYKNVEEGEDWDSWIASKEILRDQTLEIPFSVASKSFTIIETEKEYIKGSQDLTVAIAANGHTGMTVSKDGTSLETDTYSVASDKITLKSTYLNALAAGEYTFTLRSDFDTAGKTFRVNVRDKATIAQAAQEYTIPSEGHLTFAFTLNGDALTGVKDLAAENYSIEGGVLTLKAAYLNTLQAGETNFTVQTELGADLKISVNVTVLKDFTLSADSASFVKGGADIAVAYTVNDDTLEKISRGGVDLAADHYSFENGKVTLKASYLETLDAGEYTFKIIGTLASRDMNVIVRAKAAVSNNTARYTRGGDGVVSFTFTLNGDILTGVKDLAAEHYTIEGNILTFKNDYLDTLAKGETGFVVETELDADISVKVEILVLESFVLEKTSASYVKGGEDITFSYTENDDILNKITLDGSEVAKANYAFENGKIVFKASYLDTLTAGEYKFKIVSDLTEKEITVKIAEKNSGCGSAIVAGSALFAAALMLISTAFILKCRKKKV